MIQEPNKVNGAYDVPGTTSSMYMYYMLMAFSRNYADSIYWSNEYVQRCLLEQEDSDSKGRKYDDSIEAE